MSDFISGFSMTISSRQKRRSWKSGRNFIHFCSTSSLTDWVMPVIQLVQTDVKRPFFWRNISGNVFQFTMTRSIVKARTFFGKFHRMRLLFSRCLTVTSQLGSIWRSGNQIECSRKSQVLNDRLLGLVNLFIQMNAKALKTAHPSIKICKWKSG